MVTMSPIQDTRKAIREKTNAAMMKESFFDTPMFNKRAIIYYSLLEIKN